MSIPNLITQANVGELFVIRNAGNIIPPFNATNGGEGAAVEYAIEALGIEQVIVCGHSHCGAMKGLLQMSKLADRMPLVYEWLKQAEATRRLIMENYDHVPKEDLIQITVAENVLTQLENLNTYPVIRSRLHQGKLSLHGWIYNIEKGEVLTYDPLCHDFVTLENRKNNLDRNNCDLSSTRLVNQLSKANHNGIANRAVSSGYLSTDSNSSNSHLPKSNRISTSQAERIYKGSY